MIPSLDSALGTSRRHGLVAALLLLALTGCPQPPPESDPDDPTRFPVRLLPAEESESSVLHEWTFDESTDLSDWRLLRSRQNQLVIEELDPEVAVVRDGALVLSRTKRDTLLRFVEIPEGVQLDTSVRLDPHGDPIVGDPIVGDHCKLFTWIYLDDLREGETVEEFVARNEVRLPGGEGKIRTIERILPQRLKSLIQRDFVRWGTRRSPDGFAEARQTIFPRKARQVWALAAPTALNPVRIKSVRIVVRPEFNVVTRTAQSGPEGGNGDDLPPIGGTVKLWGEMYRTAYVPAGESVTLEAHVPVDARKLSFAVAPDEEAPRPIRAGWRVEVETRPDVFTEVDAGTLEHGEPTPPLYSTVIARWPHVDESIESVRVRFHAVGDTGVYFGQPVVRGPPRDERPNLLFISIDTLRADHLGFGGYERPTSPFLDQLAEESAVFANFSSVGPYTLPTHATMLTGLFPRRHGAMDNFQRLETANLPYLPRALAAEGYITAGFTSGGFLSDEFGFSRGFDRYGIINPIRLENEPRGQNRTADRLRDKHDVDATGDWILEHKDERWFAFLHTFVVHEYKAPEEDIERFDTAPDVTEGRDHREYLRSKGWYENPPSPGDVEQIRNLYDATIRYCDRELGRLLGRLEEAGVLDDTIVVITSDHGEEFFEHGSFKHSVTLYDEMLNVPLLIRIPDGEGRKVTEPTSMADLTPTLLDLLGVPSPGDLDGSSKAARIRGESTPTELTPLYAHVDTKDSRRAMLRFRNLKVIRNDISDRVNHPGEREWELYDLVQDRGETSDRSESLPARLDEMRDRMTGVETFLSSVAVEGSTAEVPDSLREQMEQLGYLGFKKK